MTKEYRFFVRLTSALLAFLFIITPVAPVLAQEAASNSTAPVESADTSVSPINTESAETVNADVGKTKEDSSTALEAGNNKKDTSLPVSGSDKDKKIKDKDGTNTTDVQPMSATSGTESSSSSSSSSQKQIILNPNDINGPLTYDYPIVVPPGRNGLQPDLSLGYNSQLSVEENFFGYGWNVSIPYIERINRKGTDKLYTESYFNSSLSGELVLVSGTSYGSKTDNGEFLKYEFTSNSWLVTDKKGTKYKFGYSASTRQDNPNDSTKVFKWNLEEIRDTNDNYIKYEYFKDNGQIYPSRIVYTGSGAIDGVFEVEFLREAVSGAPKSYRTEFLVTTNYRVNEIRAKVNGNWVKKYVLGYTTANAGMQSLLSSIMESGQDELSNVKTLPATTFSYQTINRNWTQDTSWTVPISFYYGDGANGEGQSVRITDVNGDGLSDILKSIYQYSTQLPDGTWQDVTDNEVYLNNGHGWVQDTSWIIPLGFYDGQIPDITQSTQVVDINGDNLPDLIRSRHGGSIRWSDGTFHSTPAEDYSKVYLNNGYGWTLDSSWSIPLYFYDGGEPNIAQAIKIADINGDGLPDLLKSWGWNNYLSTEVYLNNGHGWTQDTSWTIPISFYYGGSANDEGQSVRITDVNGDGLSDILKSMYQYSTQLPDGTWQDVTNNQVYLNNGHGWTQDASWIIPLAFYGQENMNITGSTQIIDVNGDNLPDLLRSRYGASMKRSDGTTTSTTDEKKVYLNNGRGWTLDTSWTIPLYFYDGRDSNIAQAIKIADINGDNLPDLLSSWGWNNYLTTEVYLNNGPKSDLLTRIAYSTGGRTDITYKATPLYTTGSNLSNPNLPFIMDTVQSLASNDSFGNTSTTTYSYEGGKYYYNNAFDRKFAGFAKVTKTDAAGNATKTYYHQGDTTNSSQGEYLDHISKAGKPYRTEIYDNSNNLYSKAISKWENYDLVGVNNLSSDLAGYWNLNEGTGTIASDSSGNGHTGTLENMESTDWVQGISGTALNLDGTNERVDLGIMENVPTGKGITVSAWIKPTELTSGGHVISRYSPSGIQYSLWKGGSGVAFFINGGSSGNYVDVNNVLSTSAWTHVVGVFDDTTKEHKIYVNGTLAASRTYNVSLNNPAVKTYIGTSNYNQDYFNGKIDETKVYNRVLTSQEITALYNNPELLSGNERDFVKLTQKIDSSYDGNATHKDKAETYSYDNTNGNLTEKIQWGEVTGSDNGTFTDTGTDKLATTISYASNPTLNLIGLPSQETTLDQNNAKVKESKYYYDTLALGSADKGNLTKGEDWKSGTDYINTQKSYNSYGLVTQETDPRGKITTYTYDSYNLYPATVTNALSQATQYTYDYSAGKAKQVIDPNNFTFQTVYDGLDRVIEEKQPDLITPPTLITKAAYLYTDTANAVSVKKTDYLDGTNSVDSYSYFDGLGRLIQTRKEAETANNFSVKDFVYNNRGLLNKESLPYFSSGTAKTSATADNTLYSTYSYDPLTRITSTVNAVGTVTNIYDDWKVTTTDAKGTPKDLYKDAYGNLIQVDEHNGASTYTTTYNYDRLGDLTKITDALGNIRNFTYDGLGRRLTAEDLHALADATFGTWTYTYDANGNLTSQLDPKNQTVNYTYDDLNRQLTEDYIGQSGTEVTYSYDTCANGIGRLCSVVSSSETEAKNYNSLGLISSEIETIDSVGYPTSYAYDRQGNQVLITNPDNSQVKYLYNAAGQLEQVQRKESADADFTNVVTDFDYSPLEKITYQAYTNGTSTTNTYDATKLYRLSSKVTTLTGGSTTGYSYRKAITINNLSTENLISYQAPIIIDTSDPSKFHNNCADIRFTNDGVNWDEGSWTISYPYWIESGCGTANTKIWVKIDSISANSSKDI